MCHLRAAIRPQGMPKAAGRWRNPLSPTWERVRVRGTGQMDGRVSPRQSRPLSLDGCFAQLTSFPRRRESSGVGQTGTRGLFGLVTAPISSHPRSPTWERARAYPGLDPGMRVTGWMDGWVVPARELRSRHRRPTYSASSPSATSSSIAIHKSTTR